MKDDNQHSYEFPLYDWLVGVNSENESVEKQLMVYHGKRKLFYRYSVMKILNCLKRNVLAKSHLPETCVYTAKYHLDDNVSSEGPLSAWNQYYYEYIRNCFLINVFQISRNLRPFLSKWRRMYWRNMSMSKFI